MAKFIYVYHGGSAPESPEEGQKAMQAWMAWFGEMGEAVIDGGHPLGMSKTVTSKGVTNDGGANPSSGYSIVTAKDIDAAVKMSKGCPMVKDGSGSVEVAECLDM